MIAKRGVKSEAVYLHAPPYTSERAKQKVVDLAKLVSKYAGTIELHVINFTDIQLAIYEKCPHEELTIIMRRYMMKIAENIANDNNCLGLITGESIGQIASQTMQSLAAPNEVCTISVYRPISGFDKQVIIVVYEKKENIIYLKPSTGLVFLRYSNFAAALNKVDTIDAYISRYHNNINITNDSYSNTFVSDIVSYMTRIAPEDYISSSNLTAYRSFSPRKDVIIILLVKKDGVSTTKETTFYIEAGKITYL